MNQPLAANFDIPMYGDRQVIHNIDPITIEPTSRSRAQVEPQQQPQTANMQQTANSELESLPTGEPKKEMAAAQVAH